MNVFEKNCKSILIGRSSSIWNQVLTHLLVCQKMDLTSVVEALKATLSPQLRKQAEDTLAQVVQHW